MITMIETMNNYDDLAAKAKAKADAISRLHQFRKVVVTRT